MLIIREKKVTLNITDGLLGVLLGFQAFLYIWANAKFPSFLEEFSFSIAVLSYFTMVFLSSIWFKHSVLYRLPEIVGFVFMMMIALIFLSDFVVYESVGMHINTTVLKFMAQPGALMHAGISVSTILKAALPLLISILLFVGLYLFFRRFVWNWSLKWVELIAVFAILAFYLVYSYQMLVGAQSAYVIKRVIPYKVLPSRYNISRVGDIIFGEGAMKNVSRSHYVLGEDRPSNGVSLAVIPAVKKPLNIILVVAESFRGDDIIMDRGIAPYLYEWAEKGGVLTSAFSGANCTHLSIYSMISGLPPINYNEIRSQLKTPYPIQVLERNGFNIYTTESISLDWYDLVDFIFGKSVSRSVFSADGKSLRTTNGYVESDRKVTNRALDIALSYQKEGRPYFNFVYYNSTHYPYQSPVDKQRYQPALVGDIDLDEIKTPEGALKLRNRYKNSLSYVDSEFGRLMAGLKDLGALDNSVVIFTADHGEELYEQGKLGHNTQLNSYQIKVPFFIHIPEPMRGDFDSENISHLDVMPTILGLLGVESQIQYLAGRNLIGNNKGRIISADCGPGYPDGFLVNEGGSNVLLDYDDGYISIIPGQSASEKEKNGALKVLVELMRGKL